MLEPLSVPHKERIVEIQFIPERSLSFRVKSTLCQVNRNWIAGITCTRANTMNEARSSTGMLERHRRTTNGIMLQHLHVNSTVPEQEGTPTKSRLLRPFG